MNIYRTLSKLCITIVLLISIVASCKKDDNQPVSYSYFVSKELVAEYSTNYIGSLIDIVSLSVPEAAQFKQLMTSDVEVYKIVYETTVDGNKINASGLISVPATKGEYPLLSFQNGTNTVYANAPSELPKDYSYQMIEILASMGYVVVFADYPGFGVSTQIPHPYLVKEPTVTSLVDLLYAAREISDIEFPGITIKNEEYLLGYSQGGWATLALHKALELDYSGDFNLAGSSCGAGPYNTLELFESMVDQQTYPMPVYLAYIMNAYTSYDQFTNPVSDIFNEPYASRVPVLFNGTLTSGEINNQLTTSIAGLLTADFISGYKTSPKYSTVISALTNNSISAWHTNKPVLFTHGGGDTQVNPIATENIYDGMIAAGTSSDICKKVIVPNVDHGDGIVPCLTKGILFLNSLKESNN
jgi:pimeloyl-ACP methyl ester carboxylesterase